MERKHSKISIIGAGLVGATAAYAIATRKLVSELVVIDVNKDKAKGEAMDISHGLVTMDAMNIHDGDYSEIADSDVIVVTAGLGRKPGESRLDLAAKNIVIAKDIAANIAKYYNGGVVLVVANPLDMFTYVIRKYSGLPAHCVVGTGTSLDSARFRYLLARELNVDTRNIHGFMSGEHGDSQFAVWSGVHVSGMPIDSYCEKKGIKLDKPAIENAVRTAGGEVIKLKGATFYAIASVVAELCNVIIKNTRSVHNVSTLLEDYHGISDVCISVPAVLGINGVEEYVPYDYTEEETEKLRSSAKKMREFLDNLNI